MVHHEEDVLERPRARGGEVPGRRELPGLEGLHHGVVARVERQERRHREDHEEPNTWHAPTGATLAFEKRSPRIDRKSTRLNSSHANISYAVFCLKKKKIKNIN